MANNPKVNEAVIVSVSLNEDGTGVLIVGRQKKKNDVEIINAFQGEEAWSLYNKLTKKNVEA